MESFESLYQHALEIQTHEFNDSLLFHHIDTYLWHYRLWSFISRDTKSDRFLYRNQHTQRKLLNFENWINGEHQ